MAFKPRLNAQLNSQTGMGRPGGAASKASMPNINGGTGSTFAAMENTLLKGAAPNPKTLAGGGSGRQFFTKASGGDMAGIVNKNKIFKMKTKKV